MIVSFDAESRSYNLPRLEQELGEYKATARLVRTKLESGDKRGEYGPWRLEVSITEDEVDRNALDAIVEAHDPKVDADPGIDSMRLGVLLALAKGEPPDQDSVQALELAAQKSSRKS